MRKLKAIYLIPVFLLLAIGLAAGGYYMLIVPAVTKTKDAHKAWTDAKATDTADLEGSWAKKLEAERTDATKLLSSQDAFRSIQANMGKDVPIDNFDAVHPLKQDAKSADLKKAFLAWYTLNTTPRVPNILRRWATRFFTGVTPSFNPAEYFSGPLLMPGETFPNVKIVEVELALDPKDRKTPKPITLWARGYPDLLNQLRKRTGYGFYPMLIQPVDGENADVIHITVHRDHPRHTPQKPVLTMDITAKVYFMTQGWDPNGDPTALKDLIDKAKSVLLQPKKPRPQRKSFNDPNVDTVAYPGLSPDDRAYLHNLYQSKGWCKPPSVMMFLEGEAKGVTP